MSSHRDRERDAATPAEQTVQVLVANEGNRTALAELLGERYDVETSQSVEPADSYLVEDGVFSRYHDALRERVEQSDPVFCPVVLVRREEGLGVSLPDLGKRESPPLVDDIVDAPVDRLQLFRRFETLLGRREQSVELRDRLSELESRERELRSFKRAVEHSGHAIFITDLDGTIEYVNSAFEETTGYAAEEVIGVTPRVLKSGEHDPEYYETLWGTILDGEVWQREVINERKNGEQYVAVQTIAPIEAEDGTLDRFVAVHHDITDRKEFERRLKRQRDRLDVLNQMARHDIRNDMQVALTRAQQLRTHVDEDGEEYLEMVLSATENAIDLTTTARDLTDVMLHTESELEAISLDRILTTEIEAVRSENESGVVETAGSVPAVCVEADGMLESALRNLLTNAIVHNDSDVPEVTVSVELREETVLVSVADNGPGVPPDQFDDIFEKSQKGTDSSGTGLGLYLVSTLVDRYGGDVWVENRHSQRADSSEQIDGAVFNVELVRA